MTYKPDPAVFNLVWDLGRAGTHEKRLLFPMGTRRLLEFHRQAQHRAALDDVEDEAVVAVVHAKRAVAGNG